MAVTRLADIIKPEVFNQYVVNTTVEKSALFRSGIAQAVPGITVPNGGDTVNMPFWNDLDGDAEPILTDNSLTPGKITSGKDVARVLEYGKAWSAEDLAGELAGSDPMTVIGGRVADYWTRQYQKMLINILEGVFADNVTNDGGDLILDIASEDFDNETTPENFLMDGSAIIDAAQLLGDAKSKFTAIAMHSMVHSNLQKLGLIEFIPEHEANIGWGTYMGKSVVVDDNLPIADGTTSGKKYTSYLFAQGAIGYVQGSPKTPTETDRNSLKGEDILINRAKFIMHPRGVAWQEGSVAGAFPTYAELADGANYNRVYDKKKIRVVKVVTNG